MMSKNPLEKFSDTTKRRTVWETKNGARLLTVTDLLPVGEYEIKKETAEDGIITLRCTPIEEGNDGEDS